MLGILTLSVQFRNFAQQVPGILEHVDEWDSRTGLRLPSLLAGGDHASPLKRRDFGKRLKKIHRLPFTLQQSELCVGPTAILQRLPRCIEGDGQTGKSHQMAY